MEKKALNKGQIAGGGDPKVSRGLEIEFLHQKKRTTSLSSLEQWRNEPEIPS